MNNIQEVINLPSGLNITKHSFQFIINSIKKAPKIPFASLENPQNTSSSVNRVIVETLNFYLIIDGLDDALRGEKFSSDIITGLIRAAESINMELYHSQIHFKVIILLRSDIFELCRDPDITKLKRDVTINLSWTKDDLKNIVLWRIKGKYPKYKSFDDFWYEFAPEHYKGKKSSPLLMVLTLLRPRDILQFFLECQDLYGERDTISYSELSTTIASYSKNYLISEMKDELTGIISDEIITAIPYIFSELG